tara:strand:+ start:7569 stop:9272 length:1704 start_codon:yes stop_codon:yes gene_type:complete
MNLVEFKHISHCWAALTAEELYRLGCRDICIAPGSRSTPLVMAFANHKDLQCHTHFDERSLSFFALGLAKASLKPVVIVTTSGSAVANLLPAIVEAFQNKIPLLILSSDRPYQLHYHGSNQTISQEHIFGSYVKLFQTIPSPTDTISPKWLLATLDEAFFEMQTHDPAPVHLNFMFEEPFFNQSKSFDYYLKDIFEWKKSKKTFKHINPITPQLTADHKIEDSFENTLVLIGHINNDVDARLIYDFCESNKLPVLAECHSKLFGLEKIINHVDMFIDLFLKTNQSNYTILFFGEQLISKKCFSLISNATKCIHITDKFASNNPSFKTDLTLKSTYEDNLTYLNQYHLIPKNTWTEFISKTKTALYSRLEKIRFSTISEISVMDKLFSKLEKSSLIFIANSLSIRLLNSHIPSKKHHIIYANRGVSGIDGNLSTAIGIAKNKGKELYFICGDLTFLYDLNALVLLEQTNVVVKICLLNNNGGKIFTFLPIQEHFTSLNPYFTTPHNLKMKYIAKQFNLNYDFVSDDSFADLSSKTTQFIHNEKSCLLECFFDENNTKLHLKSSTEDFL